ncbi:MAG: hypothetical protein U1F77_04550 [Kiritimatiellia bacterium]
MSTGAYLSFSVTIPAGVTVNLTSLALDYQTVNTVSYSNARVFSTIDGFDNVTRGHHRRARAVDGERRGGGAWRHQPDRPGNRGHRQRRVTNGGSTVSPTRPSPSTCRGSTARPPRRPTPTSTTSS